MDNRIDDVPAGFKETELGLLPVEWDTKRLSELVSTIKGKKTNEIVESNHSDAFAYLTADCFRTGIPSKFVKLTARSSVVEVSDNEIVLIWDGSNAGDVFIGKNGILASTMVKIICNKKLVDENYLYFFLKTKFDLFNTKTTGSTIPHINKQVFQDLLVPLPNRTEQRAIAYVLSTIQRSIEAQDKVIAAARELKKSLMRHLFTYGPVPVTEIDKVELKETEIGLMPGNWTLSKLGKYIEKPEYGYTETATNENVGPKFLRITDLQDGYVNWSSVPYCKCENTLTKKYLLATGDILVARIGATTGKTYIVRDYPESIFASYLIRIRTKSDLLAEYLYQFTLSPYYWNQINATKGGRLKQGINIPNLMNLNILIPSTGEQQTIIDCLLSLDQKIQAEENRKSALQTLFKTMLHLLMTGKIRVKDLDLIKEH